jgi:hypothetical protein
MLCIHMEELILEDSYVNLRAACYSSTCYAYLVQPQSTSIQRVTPVD